MPADTSVLVAGGAVQAGGGLYLQRSADRDLLAYCRNGEFTYILTSRQMGKSSLMIRTAERLVEDGARPVIVDLTEIGAQTTAEQWYRGLLFTVGEQLGLATSAARWWDAHAEFSVGHRFARFFTEVVLRERPERIVVFVDEIDTTLRLTFTDDFFAGIRYLYQARASEPDLQRLSFVLIGVATPGDLIKDAGRTPFNIGHRLDLIDFTFEEALPLAAHLPISNEHRSDVMRWILHWTGGHPYLTLRVVRSFDDAPAPSWTERAVDERVAELFFSQAGENDSNLQFVRDMLTKNAFDKEAVLRTYRDVRRGRPFPDRELDQVAAWLKLSGVVCRRDGALEVRNAIYERVFDQRWARHHLWLHTNWRRRAARTLQVLVAIIGLITIPLSAVALWQWRLSDSRRVEAVDARKLAESKADEARRASASAEASANKTLAALRSAEAALEELRRYNPKLTETLSANISAERQGAEKEFADRTAKLRIERDDALAKLQISERSNQSLADENNRLKTTQNGSDVRQASPMVATPDVLGRDRDEAQKTIEQTGLRANVRLRSSSATAATVVAQAPMGGTMAARGSPVDLLVSSGEPRVAPSQTAAPNDAKGSNTAAQLEITLDRLHVFHDSTPRGTIWTFEVQVDGRTVITLPETVYHDGTIIRLGKTATVRPIAPSARITVVGIRQKEKVALSVQGAGVLPVEAGQSFETSILTMAKSVDPLDGEFLFVFKIQPQAMPQK
ncbi:MAG: AAA-like domain-containing protein [Vicinamibacterales bacterium]